MTKKNSIFVVCKWRKIMERNAQTYEEILNAINEHLKSSGRRYYSDFYIGVSEDAAKQLAYKHHVGRRDWWIYRAAESSDTACEVKKHYLDLGMRGNTATAGKTKKMVYCYAVTPTTTE